MTGHTHSRTPHQSHFHPPLTERLWRVRRWTLKLLTPLFYPPILGPPGPIASPPPLFIKDNLTTRFLRAHAGALAWIEQSWLRSEMILSLSVKQNKLSADEKRKREGRTEGGVGRRNGLPATSVLPEGFCGGKRNGNSGGCLPWLSQGGFGSVLMLWFVSPMHPDQQHHCWKYYYSCPNALRINSFPVFI